MKQARPKITIVVNDVRMAGIMFAIIMVLMSAGQVCAGNFFTSTEFDPVLISEKSEIEIGRNTDQQVRQKYRISADPNLNQRINAMGQKLASVSDRKNIPYVFTVVQDEQINAFAAPGGYVYITTGILKKLKNDDEIAAVLSHEIGHVVNRHSLKAVQRQMLAQFGLQILAGMLGDGGLSGGMLLKASEISASLLLLKNSRVNELESDREGVEIMRRAGYNPRAMVDVQRMLMAQSQGKPGWAIISTHPPSQERIVAIEQAIQGTR